MDITLFTKQVNQVLSHFAKEAWLEETCALLRMHTKAGVRLTGSQNIDIIHLLPDSLAKGEYKLEYQNLILYNLKKPPDVYTQQAAYIVSAVCTVILRYEDERFALEQKRRLQTVRGVINTLSFSELEAAIHICHALDGGEGLLVAGHIADKLNFARSVVVNALRKLESAGAVETRSLGMKGTYIKIKDKLLAEELEKLS